MHQRQEEVGNEMQEVLNEGLIKCWMQKKTNPNPNPNKHKKIVVKQPQRS